MIDEVAKNIVQQAKQNNVRYHTIREADCFNKKPGVSSVTSKHNRKKTVKLTISPVKLLHSEVEPFHPELAHTSQNFKAFTLGEG